MEDDLTMRQLVVDYLTVNGLRAISASRRDQVLVVLAQHKTNLVVLDPRFGQEDGLDLLREIRARADAPVIIVTGHRREEIACGRTGTWCGCYLIKPFGLRELLARFSRQSEESGGLVLLCVVMDDLPFLDQAPIEFSTIAEDAAMTVGQSRKR
ncbi:response regulator [Bradyrhizobium liaoningense]|uniref:response regulator n=1 Tax=Bradyrhizobium liaoningense TaxID=43992 RepID=UPI001BAC5987|nr:response regulator [Bradyrhizobium liaoningense]